MPRCSRMEVVEVLYLSLIQTRRVSRTDSYEGAVGRWCPGSRVC